MTVVDRRRPDISLDLPREKPAFAQYLTKSSAVVNSAVVSAIAVINGGHKEFLPDRNESARRENRPPSVQDALRYYPWQELLDKSI